ncbi:vascular-related unknown protein 1-like isoform X1 [Typha latifolia]|uniref:vascular-related unknown protein 1-like isoform X1 n=1 Tax=Typha latifolia TaxID=4733 RepID=UPI003C2CEC9D
MENSHSSSMDNSFFSEEQTAASENSGWSLYIDDFLASEKKEATSSGWSSSTCTGGDRSSMVSGDASYVEWKTPGAVKLSKVCKKRKGRRFLDDESLEDTATSAANGLKVSEFYHFDVIPKKKKDRRDDSQEKHAPSENYGDLAIHEIHEVSGNEKRYECNELRKRGLCLVPVSMLLNYLG